MDEPHLVPASAVNLDQLTIAFNRAFEGYIVPLSQTAASLQQMVRTNDVDLRESLVALDRQDAPVGIGLIARRDERAWVGGMGLAPEWRRRGLGMTVMGALIERARAAGLRRMQLEVLEENTPARRIYERLGFVDERPLLIYNDRPSVTNAAAALETGEEVRLLPAADALLGFAAMHMAVAPCWQRELPSLRHMSDGLEAHGLYGPDGLRAYVLSSRTIRGLALLDAGTRAPTADGRVRQIVAVVRAMLERSPRVALRAINVPPGDPLGDALNALGCAVASRQCEMALALTS